MIKRVITKLELKHSMIKRFSYEASKSIVNNGINASEGQYCKIYHNFIKQLHFYIYCFF